jgi:hypothetical protein
MTETSLHWRKAQYSKYQHLYGPLDMAICRSTTRPVLGWQDFSAPKCPKCLAAAKEVLDDVGDPAPWKDVSPDSHKMLLAAIAKATGTQ